MDELMGNTSKFTSKSHSIAITRFASQVMKWMELRSYNWICGNHTIEWWNYESSFRHANRIFPLLIHMHAVSKALIELAEEIISIEKVPILIVGNDKAITEQSDPMNCPLGRLLIPILWQRLLFPRNHAKIMRIKVFFCYKKLPHSEYCMIWRDNKFACCRWWRRSIYRTSYN